MSKSRTASSGAALRRQILRQASESGEDLTVQQLVLLDTACAALDQAIAAERLIRKEGLTVNGARGLKSHPATGIAQSARGRLMRALRAFSE